MYSDNQRVQRTNTVNHAIHNFDSVLAKRIFYIVEAQIKKGMGLQYDFGNELWFNVPTKLLGNQHYKDLNNAANQLQRCRFDFKNEKHEQFNKISPFPVVQYDKRWGHIKVKIENLALQYLGDLTEGYSWYKLKSALSLNSGYAQRWYELFSERVDLKKWNNITLDIIREYFKISSDTYKRNSDFLKWVVYEPIKEISEKTDLKIDFTLINNQKRPILGFDFVISKQRTKEQDDIYTKIEKYYEDLQKMDAVQMTELLIEIQKVYSITPSVYDEIMENSSLLNAVLEADSKIKSGKVKVKTSLDRYMGGVIRKYRR